MSLHLLALFGLLDLINSLSCNEEESCAWINVTDAPDSSSVLCRGYSSCVSSPLIEISHNPDGTVWCNGAKSCYNSSIIRRTLIKSFTSNSTTPIFKNPNENTMYCNGMSSCAFVKHLENINGSIHCNGQYSCANSVIILKTGTLACQGSHACENSTIMVSSEAKVHIFGYMATHNAVFYSTGSNAHVLLSFQGINSADGATVICGDNHDCTIQCYGSGCDNLDMICNSSISCNFHRTCGPAYDGGDICSNNAASYKLLDESAILFKNLTTRVKQFLNQSYALSASEISSCSVSCNDLYSCENGFWGSWDVGNYSFNTNYNNNTIRYTNQTLHMRIILQNYDKGLICCNGERSCVMARNLSTWNVSSSRLGAAILCDGYQSCADIDEYIVAKKRGDIHVRAWNGLGSHDYQFKIATSNKNNIFCTATAACSYHTLIQSDNVFCTARQACSSDAQIRNVNNIWVVVAYGASYSKFKDIHNNVYCIASNACYGSTIENVQGSVIGLHFDALQSTSLINVTNILCDGPYACKHATLVNVKNIRSNGIDCLSSYVLFASLTTS